MFKKLFALVFLVIISIYSSDSEGENQEYRQFTDTESVHTHSRNNSQEVSPSDIRVFLEEAQEAAGEEEVQNDTESVHTQSSNQSQNSNLIEIDEARFISMQEAEYNHKRLLDCDSTRFRRQLEIIISASTVVYLENPEDEDSRVISSVNKKEMLESMDNWANSEEKLLPADDPIHKIEDDTQVLTPCKHIFHLGCIQTALQTRKSCPYCNQEINPNELKNIDNHNESHCSICLQTFQKTKKLKTS